jgi:hypothetical protein
MGQSWLDEYVSFYQSHTDLNGRPAKLRDILLSIDYKNFELINRLRGFKKEDSAAEKRGIKNQLQAFTPSGLLKCRRKGEGEVLSRSGLLQFDFDAAGIKDFHIEDLKKAVFTLPFIAFCSLSCSGTGFFALALIAEPDKLREYALHCMDVFKKYGIGPDETKGRNITDLRYVSWDQNMLVRDYPEPLKITKLYSSKRPLVFPIETPSDSNKGESYIQKGLIEVKNARVGTRWETVQRVAYTLGGFNKGEYLEKIYQAIGTNSAFKGEEGKYFKCASDCFLAGQRLPFRPK